MLEPRKIRKSLLHFLLIPLRLCVQSTFFFSRGSWGRVGGRVELENPAEINADDCETSFAGREWAFGPAQQDFRRRGNIH